MKPGHASHMMGSPAWQLFNREGPIDPSFNGIYFVTCPHRFFDAPKDPRLTAWAAASYVGDIFVNRYIFVLAPNPGCEW